MLHRSLEVLSLNQLFGIGLTLLLWYWNGFDFTKVALSRASQLKHSPNIEEHHDG